MNQPSLFHEDIWQALRDCISALGGSKKVGTLLRPEVDAQTAGRWLLDCLNTERKEKLCIEQVLFILREARKAGCHVGMNYINQDAGYAPPTPIEPEDQRAALMREFNEGVRSLEVLSRRMQKLGMADIA
jgi:hypothetical protein